MEKSVFITHLFISKCEILFCKYAKCHSLRVMVGRLIFCFVCNNQFKHMEKNDNIKLVWCFEKCTHWRPGKKLVLVLSQINCGTLGKQWLPSGSAPNLSMTVGSRRQDMGHGEIVSSLQRNQKQSIYHLGKFNFI